MNHSTRSGVVVRAGSMVLGVVGIAAIVAYAGPLNPPPGPPQPTGKTLDQIEPRRIVNDLPGAANAVHVISVPGNYVCTGDIAAGVGQNGILVTADDVTLDLNGFTLVGVAGSLDGVRVDTPTPASFAAKGHITKKPPSDGISGFGGNGVTVINAAQVSLSGLSVSNCGGNGIDVTAAPGNEPIKVFITLISIRSSGGNGIQVTISGNTVSGDTEIESCDLRNNAGHGIFITDSGTPPPPGATDIGAEICCINNVGASNGGDGVNINLTALPNSIVNVRRSSFHNNVGAGLRVSSEKCASIDNDCSFNGFTGFEVSARLCTFRACTAYNNNGDGLNIVARSIVISSCNAAANLNDGMDLSAGDPVEGVDVSIQQVPGGIVNNGGNGVTVLNGRLVLGGGAISGNTGSGISASNSSLYCSNVTVTENLIGGVFCDDYGRVRMDSCAVDNNTGNGLTTSSPLGLPAGPVTLRSCSFTGNSGTGCQIADSIGGLVMDCTAINNGLVGIEVLSAGHVLIRNVASANPAGNVFAVTPGNAVGPAVGAAGIVADNNFANTRP